MTDQFSPIGAARQAAVDVMLLAHVEAFGLISSPGSRMLRSSREGARPHAEAYALRTILARREIGDPLNAEAALLRLARASTRGGFVADFAYRTAVQLAVATTRALTASTAPPD